MYNAYSGRSRIWLTAKVRKQAGGKAIPGLDPPGITAQGNGAAAQPEASLATSQAPPTAAQVEQSKHDGVPRPEHPAPAVSALQPSDSPSLSGFLSEALELQLQASGFKHSSKLALVK